MMPSKMKFTNSGLVPAEQGMVAELGSLDRGVAPTKFQTEAARAGGSDVRVVPESITTNVEVELAKVTGFPLASVPETPFKRRVKSTTPGKPSNPEGMRSIVTRSPENLFVSIPPKSKVPPDE